MGAEDVEYHLHKSYWTRLQQLNPSDAEDMHTLSVAVNWPHRPLDIASLLEIGQGLIARDEISRPLGAGMCFDYGTQASMVGMMMTHPKLQAGGLGREILSALEATRDGRNLRLNATKPAWRLYQLAGFRETGRVVQYQGVCGTSAGRPGRTDLRRATPEDLPALARLDHAVFGTERPEVLGRLLDMSECYVIDGEDEIAGFAMCRPFGRGHVVGPMVAASDTDAIALADMFISAYQGRFVRLDSDIRHEALGAYLNSVGLESYDIVIPMIKGTHYGPENAADHVYALASQALG